MISVCYTGTATDYSGYGNANRQDITALFVSGVNLTTEIERQVPEKADYGLTEKIAVSLQERKIPYPVKIIHLTPDLYPMYMEKGKYHIGRLFFECDRLPPAWIEPCNQMDELWIGTDLQKEMVRRSGVSTLCTVIPQAVDVTKSTEYIEPFIFPKSFLFYSIFQFINRKAPVTLCNAFWRTFEGQDDVVLILKTYGVTHANNEYEKIENQITAWKANLKQCPKIFLVSQLLTEARMWRLHKSGSVYVNPSASEAWGRPVAEAMTLGIPVISPECGITEYMTNQYFKVAATSVPVVEQNDIAFYKAPMKWLTPDVASLGKQMRYVYENYRQAQTVGRKAQSFMIDHFSYRQVGDMMRQRLEEISRTL